MSFESVNPATGEHIASYTEHTDAELDRIAVSAGAAARDLRQLGLAARTSLLRDTAVALRLGSEPLARLISEEMGKPIREARAEIEKSAVACEYYGETAPDLLRSRPIGHDRFDTWVEFDALGPVVAVMPWNYPVWQVIRAAAPALAIGNPIVLKHAANVTGTALL